MSTVKVRALRGCCIGPGRHLAAGEVADVPPLTAAVLVQQAAAVLLDERDAPKLQKALRDDVDRQQGHRREREPGSPWQPLPIY